MVPAMVVRQGPGCVEEEKGCYCNWGHLRSARSIEFSVCGHSML